MCTPTCTIIITYSISLWTNVHYTCTLLKWTATVVTLFPPLLNVKKIDQVAYIHCIKVIKHHNIIGLPDIRRWSMGDLLHCWWWDWGDVDRHWRHTLPPLHWTTKQCQVLKCQHHNHILIPSVSFFYFRETKVFLECDVSAEEPIATTVGDTPPRELLHYVKPPYNFVHLYAHMHLYYTNYIMLIWVEQRPS